MAAFATAAEAVEAAIDGQRAIDRELSDGDTPLRVRMGLHTGTPEVRGADYFGPAVNRAARLMAVAHGGQVVMSQATAQLAGTALDASVDLIDLGEHRLRDLTEPEHVFEVRAPGLRREFPPLSSMDAFPGNLPLQVSTYVARDEQLRRVAQALTQSRVVTLTGVGGVGKTRLALQVAADAAARASARGHGSWSWRPSATPTRVADAVALGVPPAGPRRADRRGGVVEFLRTKQLLLVLDNCEHLLDACADLVGDPRAQCPELVVLATSREGLGVDGERTWCVPTLAVPADGADLGVVAACRGGAAVRRAGPAGRPRLRPSTAENAPAVVEVCRRLDGMPLAIELAAAQLVMMTPSELARRLDRRFEVLTRRPATARRSATRRCAPSSTGPTRSALRAEQRLLARLAVFAGGWSLESAEAVGADDRTSAGEVFPGPALVGRQVAGHRRARHDRDPLPAAREHPGVRRRAPGRAGRDRLTPVVHAEHFVTFEQAAYADLFGPAQAMAAHRLMAERENLLAAVSFAIDVADVDLAIRVVGRR